MSERIPEPDWRRFKEIHAKLVERFCGQILEEVAAASRATEGDAHDRYLKVYRLVQERNKQIAIAFDDFRRSTAVMQLVIMRRMGLLTDDELRLFSEQTRAEVEAVVSL